MKPTSIIFLLVALIIVFAGWLTCRSAESSAIREGIPLFSESISGEDVVNRLDFGADDVYNKIVLVVDSADINIYGGCSEPYIEIVNFGEGSYRLTNANRNITIDTTLDIMKIIKFWESGFSFRGLREYFRKDSSDGAELSKRINIYLPSDGDLNVIDVTLGEGNVSISNFDTSVDVMLDIKKGNAVFSSFRTTSRVNAEIANGDIYLNDADIGSLDVAITDEGDITAVGFKASNVNIIGNNTSVSLGVVSQLDGFNMHLSARRGDVTIDGQKLGHDYAHETNTGSGMIITVSSGDIMIVKEQERVPETGGDDATGEDSQENTENQG